MNLPFPDLKPFLPESDILPNTIWESASDKRNRVLVEKVEDGWVEYSWEERGEKRIHDKDVFSFQVRYKPEGYNEKWKANKEYYEKHYENKH